MPKARTYKESGIVAGYPAKNAAQSAYQAMKGLRGRVADLLDNAGLSEQVGIEVYLNPAPEAAETIFTQKDGKFNDKREVVAWHPRIAALRTLFELRGSHAPRDPKEAAQFGVKVVAMDMPRPPRLPINVTPTNRETTIREQRTRLKIYTFPQGRTVLCGEIEPYFLIFPSKNFL